MPDSEVTYKEFTVRPLAAYDDGMYASMLILRKPDGTQRATGVLGRFPCALEARRFAIGYDMAEIDHRRLPEPHWMGD
ncbi:hypothetical protein BG61_07790 [Caballeronia glathei]|uniref:Uncharacterized protein n=1 Tax=Caballeronia glathei TaxID=60547 RepID=A0A069PKC9_9BURK|nr:hypothetical protein BG61_07790 [Caballeronia glathei]